ncbi:hypothetical protein HY495_01735 [Candidatus Woesearchaeota archaeon]|nr:hypothetical protein [Candidatus Woesearchaeota archaeon]
MALCKCLMCGKNSFHYTYKGKCTGCGAGVMTASQAKAKKAKMKKRR